MMSRQSVAFLAPPPRRTGGHEAAPKSARRVVGVNPEDACPPQKASRADAGALVAFGAGADDVHCVLCPWPGHPGDRGRSRRPHLQKHFNGDNVETLDLRQDPRPAITRNVVGCAYVDRVTGVSIDGMAGAIA